MNEEWQQKVRERAYHIWQRQGSPDGPPEQFWLMDEEELVDEGERPTSQQAAAEPPPETPKAE